MLPREHRITRSQDFRAVMRGGARAGTDTVVVSALLRPARTAATGERATSPDEQGSSPVAPLQWRCGFIVSKAVGNAVVRHRVQRRLRHLVAEQVGGHADVAAPGEQPSETGTSGALDVVVRALPAAAGADHSTLRDDLASGLERALRRGRRHLRRRSSEDAGAAGGSAA